MRGLIVGDQVNKGVRKLNGGGSLVTINAVAIRCGRHIGRPIALSPSNEMNVNEKSCMALPDTKVGRCTSQVVECVSTGR